jgi:methylenetetrahydrofolate reductase (NADPH)
VHSDLLGAQALGVTNILLMRGSSLSADHLPRTTNVYDMDTIDFIRAAAAIRDRETPASEKHADGPQLHIGTVAKAFRPVEDWQPENLLAKADAGAQFIQLQVCMKADVIKEYVAKLVAAKITWRIQILAGLAVFPSADAARQLQKSRADVLIPRTVIDRLERSNDAEREGIQICAEILAELAETPGIAGANLMTSGAVESVAAAVKESGVRPAELPGLVN